jgi:hypothetical protein
MMDAEVRQNLWLTDLRRVGINCILIDDYSELDTILTEIACRSRGRTVYVTGSHERSSPTAKEIGRLLGIELARDLVILDGQSTGIPQDIVSAYGEECVRAGTDLRNRIHLYPNPYAMNAGFSNNPRFLPQLRQCRKALLREARIVVVFAGGMGTQLEIEMARELGCLLVPVGESLGGICADLLADPVITGPLDTIVPGYTERARKGVTIPSEVVECIFKLLG